MIRVEEVDARDFRKALRVLEGLEEGSAKQLRQELKGDLQPVANQVASAIPTASPLIGMQNQGRTGWSAVAGKVSFTPGRNRNRATNLLAIRVEPKNGVGPMIAEFAGSVSKGRTASGRAMIRKLNDLKPIKKRGGRYSYDEFRRLRPEIVKLATDIINKYMNKVERALK